MTHLKLWTLPSHYVGAHWEDWYVFLGQNRDSDSLTRSNFICGLKAVEAVMSSHTMFDSDGDELPTVTTVCENHWACGWIEWIAIHKSDHAALAVAEEIMEKLESHPVVNEDHWSELEYNEASEYWQHCSISDRVELCQRAGISVFAARRDYLPEDPKGSLLELIRA